MGEKPVNLYTVDNLAAAQGRHPNALVFGPIDVGCYGIQDSVCNIDRPYAIILSKKSINSYIAEQKKSIAQYKKEGTFEGETLPFIEFKNGAKRMVMAPTLIENSGGGSMTYGSLLVETRGGFIKLSTTRLTYGDNIDTELWRAAASIK